MEESLGEGGLRRGCASATNFRPAAVLWYKENHMLLTGMQKTYLLTLQQLYDTVVTKNAA